MGSFYHANLDNGRSILSKLTIFNNLDGGFAIWNATEDETSATLSAPGLFTAIFLLAEFSGRMLWANFGSVAISNDSEIILICLCMFLWKNKRLEMNGTVDNFD